MQILLLMLIAFGVAIFGSLVGAGGGFLLMPIFLFMYPAKSQEELTLISLFAVLANAVSAAFSYGRMKRIDYKTALILGVCTIPTSVAARFALHAVDRSQFSRIFGVVLVGIGAFILWRVTRGAGENQQNALTPKRGWAQRKISDAHGNVYEYAFDLRIGAGAAVIGGFVASFFGIGGGVLVVPILTQLLQVPAHVATSTSILVLAIGASAAISTDIFQHVAGGTLGEIPVALALAAGFGALVGAQVGTRLSGRVSARGILYLLAIAIMLAGGRLLLAPDGTEPRTPDNGRGPTEEDRNRRSGSRIRNLGGVFGQLAEYLLMRTNELVPVRRIPVAWRSRSLEGLPWLPIPIPPAPTLHRDLKKGLDRRYAVA